jgi:hypothetical protein
MNFLKIYLIAYVIEAWGVWVGFDWLRTGNGGGLL